MIETLRTIALLRDLRRGGRGSPDALAERRAALLRAAVRHAYDRVPLYRRRWDEAGVDPGSVHDVEDLPLLPPLGTVAGREALASGELLARGFDRDRLPAYPTGGSGGPPLLVPRGASEQRRWRAAGLRVWLEHGYRPWRPLVHLDGSAGPPHALRHLGVARTRWVSTELDVGDQAERLGRVGADVVVGTPSVLRRIAHHAARTGLEIPRPRAVFAAGEVLDEESSRIIARGLGRTPVGVYGMTEAGYLAWQCERGEGYHVNADTCILEVLRDGRPVADGEVGEILVTDLRGRTAPLVRYETGDLAVSHGGACPCGRPFPLLGTIEGRARDAARLPDGRLLTTRALVDHMAGTLAPDRYRLVQEEPSRFRLHLERPNEEAADRVRLLLGDVDVRVVAGIPPAPGAGEKSRPLVSEVNRGRPGAPLPDAGTPGASGP